MAQVTFGATLQPAPACYPPDINSMLNLIAGGGLTGTVPDNAGGGIFVGSTQPSDSLTNKVWFKIDSVGRPLGIFMHYNGNWRKVYTGVGIGEIRMIYYSPSEFDTSGRGVIGGNWDGWLLCNGQNGTPNLTDSRFPAGVTWNGQVWVAHVPVTSTDQSAGGQGRGGHTITANNLPQLKVSLQTQGGVFGGSGGTHVVLPPYASPPPSTWDEYNITQGGANDTGPATPLGSPLTHLPLPNFIARGFVIFFGYQ